MARIIEDIEQRSHAWIERRLGKPTSSQFHRILTPAKKALSAQRFKYRNELLSEWLDGVPSQSESSVFMERGTLMEEDARAWFAAQTGLPLRQVGMVETDDGGASCSPDALVGDSGGLEIKCPSLAVHIGYVLDGIDAEYRCQIQGSMWIAERREWWFCSYSPVLEPVLIKVDRDEEFIAALAEAVGTFRAELAESRSRLEKLGAKPLLRMPSREEPPDMEALEAML